MHAMSAKTQQFELAGVTEYGSVPTLTLHHSIVVPDHQPVTVGFFGHGIVVLVQINISHALKLHGSITYVTLVHPRLQFVRKVLEAYVIIIVKRKHDLHTTNIVG
jgi:hypothetical protein